MTDNIKYNLLQDKIIDLLKKRNAVIVAHYYTHPEIQRLAEITGGCVADSLEMARFGANHHADVLVVVGVRFMGETAKILNKDKIVLMPTLNAECSLDIGCPKKEFDIFCSNHPERTIVVYANTSAEVKASADWVVTSRIAIDLINYLDRLGEKIIWAPDRHLGNYIKNKTNADMICWQSSCIVHDEFKASSLLNMKKIYPKAAILVHPESPQSVVNLADVVGSTSQLIEAAKYLPNKQIIVATDKGIFFKMQKMCPDKILLEAPTAGEGATCKTCAHCPWMAMNDLQGILNALDSSKNHEILLDNEIIQKAIIPLNRMLSFSENIK